MFNFCDQGTETGILLTNTVTCLTYSTLYLNKTKPKKKENHKKNPKNKQTKKTPKQKQLKNQTIILISMFFKLRNYIPSMVCLHTANTVLFNTEKYYNACLFT